jgi:type II restriction enzyme
MHLNYNGFKTTNFIYSIENTSISNSEMHRINQFKSRNKIKDRISEITSKGGQFKFKTLENEVFKNNLILIDSLLPNVISEMILLFFTSNSSSIKTLCQEVSKSNPLNFDNQNSHAFYEYKIKRFLKDIALGMEPSKVWSGKHNEPEGYLIANQNGDLIYSQQYNGNQFEDYLFENTKLETASSSRHEFGTLYKNSDSELYFKLNLQIRFN